MTYAYLHPHQAGGVRADDTSQKSTRPQHLRKLQLKTLQWGYFDYFLNSCTKNNRFLM